MGQNSCQPEGLQPESALASLLVLAIERLLPSPGALPSPILAATHTCFSMLGTLKTNKDDDGYRHVPAHAIAVRAPLAGGSRARHRAGAGRRRTRLSQRVAGRASF